ncbi:hypothetical protein PTUN_b0878 [Pseudoalteromonas tunicata]|nr:hypothetical protein PTUN_b0878 [Pseudoalteromonas tunicata]
MCLALKTAFQIGIGVSFGIFVGASLLAKASKARPLFHRYKIVCL